MKTVDLVIVDYGEDIARLHFNGSRWELFRGGNVAADDCIAESLEAAEVVPYLEREGIVAEDEKNIIKRIVKRADKMQQGKGPYITVR